MSDDEFEINVNASQIKDKFTDFTQTKTGKATIITTLILIPLILGFLIRAQPLTGQNIDRIAQANADQQLQRQFAQEIRANNSNLGVSQLQRQAQQRVQQFKEAQPSAYQQRVQQITKQVSSNFKKPDGEPYLIAIDPYYWWRHTENVMDHGYGADTIKDGEKWNTYMYAPVGRQESFTALHPILSAHLGTLISNITNTTPYMVFFTLPAIIGALAAIPSFFLGRRLGGLFGGFIASTITATHQVFVSRSVAGFSDTDPYNITLPLFIFWFTVEAFTAKTTRARWIWGSLSAVFMGILAKAWQAWWLTYIFVLVTAAAVFAHSIGRDLIQRYKDGESLTDDIFDRDWTNQYTALGVLIGSGIVVALVRSFLGLFSLVQSVLENLAINQAAKASLWPNVLTTVAELGDTTFSSVVGTLGSQFLVFVSFLATLLFFLPENIETDEQKRVYYSYIAGSITLFAIPFLFAMSVTTSIVFFALPVLSGYFITMFEEQETISMAFPVFLSSWMIALLFASVRGTRFTMILMPAYAVALGTGIGWAAKKLITKARESESRDGTYTWSIVASIVILIGLLVPYGVQADGWRAGQRLPSMNDAWHDSLTTIANNSDEDAIITSWWDFGHWFKAIGDRSVTFDGASQNTPMAHWVGRSLQTSNPDEAKSILRMLHCGSYTGYDTLLEAKHDIDKAGASAEQYLDTKQTLDEALTYNDRSNVESYYESQGLTSDEANNVSSLTHCKPPENFLITSDDMVGKGPVWGHFGLWDFGKAYAEQTFNPADPQGTIESYSENIGVSEEQARQYYLRLDEISSSSTRQRWISPRPQFATRGTRSCETTESTITCEVNLNLGQGRQGQQVRLEEVITQRDNKSDTRLIAGVYNPQTGFRQGQQEITPAEVSVGEDGSITTYNKSGNERLGVFLHESSQERWEVLLASPELTTSMFTRLYFLDGAYTEDFELVTDEQSRVTGNRVKVWRPDLT